MTLPSQRHSKGIIQDNPEKLQLLLFPAITLGLFLAGIVALWLINSIIPVVTPWAQGMLQNIPRI